MSTGERLRRARLDSGLTLDRVADTTKIQLWILHSIERDDLSRVPGGVFVRGYIASFAREVGLDPNEILAEHFGPPQQPAVMQAPDIRRPVYTGTPLWQFAALILLVAATVVVWRNNWRGAPDTVVGHADASAPPALAPAPPPAPAPTPGAVPASSVEPAAPAIVPAVTHTTVQPAPVSASDVTASEPTEPIEPAAPTEPTEPAEPTEPTASTASTGSTEPGAVPEVTITP